MSVQLETERAILRLLARKDCRMLMMAIGHPKIAETTLNIPHPYTLETAYAWIERVNDPALSATSVQLGVFLKDSGELVGGVGLSPINRKHRKADLGYWCAFEHWNRGITTEAASRLVRYGFEELDLERIRAKCFADNIASARVMEKVGMVYEGLARHEFVKDGRFVDFHHYAVLREDWRKLQE